MMEPRLQQRLAELAHIRRRARLGRLLARCWAVAAAFGVALMIAQVLADWEFSRIIRLLPLLAGVILSIVVINRQIKPADDIQPMLRELEANDPEVRHLFAAAAEQEPAPDSGGFRFLQMRVIEEALNNPWQAVWRVQLRKSLARARGAAAVSLLALAAVVFALNRGATHGATLFAGSSRDDVTVTPGNAQVERGTALVVAARFDGSPPAEATLVMRYETGKESRLPMARRLADPVFGATIPEMAANGIYHVEYRGRKTPDYKITVFDFPALVRADAELRYPAYTDLTNRVIRDTLRVSAVTGTRLNYTLQLNKPVRSARLVGKEQSLTLAAPSNAVALLPDFVLTNSAHYSLELVDAEGRANKFPTDIVLQALTNQRPVVKLVFPRGDPRVSPLEELQLSAEASDDFGLLKYGVGFGIAGSDPKFVELGQTTPANVKRQFSHLISLEKLGVEAEQAVAYFAWADDYGPDGQPRRTFSDMFFAEVRPFEEIFRADQSGGSDGGEQQGSQSGQGGANERVRLAELQKQIVIATWNLQREKTGAGGAIHP
jgi:hypothetical protein